MKTILITGCSSGIGLECAQFLREKGFLVFPTARKEKDVTKLKKLGFQAFLLDLRKKETITVTLEEILKITDGKLDALFNNGAFGQPGAIEDLSTEVLKEQFETNFFGWHELTTQVIPIMRRQGYGRVVQNSSVLGLITLKFRGAYNASKFAIEGYSDTLRQELEETNIKISLIEPGPIKSSFRANALLKFKENIDVENSYFKDIYKNVLTRLESKKSDDTFTLPERAVAEKLHHALTAPKPKMRYYVTTPTYILGGLRRVLSTKMLDKVLNKISNSENR